jgi:hypothetical protein
MMKRIMETLNFGSIISLFALVLSVVNFCDLKVQNFKDKQETLSIHFNGHDFHESFKITPEQIDTDNFLYNASIPILFTFIISNTSSKNVSINFIGLWRKSYTSAVFTNQSVNKIFRDNIQTDTPINIDAGEGIKLVIETVFTFYYTGDEVYFNDSVNKETTYSELLNHIHNAGYDIRGNSLNLSP